MFDALIGLAIAAAAIVGAFLFGRRKGGKAERDKAAEAYVDRKGKIDAAGNDAGGLDRPSLDDRLRKHTK